RMFRLHEASKYLDIWLKRWPDDPQALWLKGVVHQDWNQPKDAAANFRRAVKADPGYDDARLSLAGVLLDLGQSREPLPHLEYLHRRQPDNARVPLALARCRDHRGQTKEADALLAGILEREPRFGPALIERGRLAFRAGRQTDAED